MQRVKPKMSRRKAFLVLFLILAGVGLLIWGGISLFSVRLVTNVTASLLPCPCRVIASTVNRIFSFSVIVNVPVPSWIKSPSCASAIAVSNASVLSTGMIRAGLSA